MPKDGLELRAGGRAYLLHHGRLLGPLAALRTAIIFPGTERKVTQVVKIFSAKG